MAATFRAFIGDDLAAKKAGEYHFKLMHRGLDQAGVDVAIEWVASLSEPHEVLLMMALYENHARWLQLEVEWMGPGAATIGPQGQLFQCGSDQWVAAVGLPRSAPLAPHCRQGPGPGG